MILRFERLEDLCAEHLRSVKVPPVLMLALGSARARELAAGCGRDQENEAAAAAFVVALDVRAHALRRRWIVDDGIWD
jgi:hypothetical protein